MLHMITINHNVPAPLCPFLLAEAEEEMDRVNTGDAMMIAFGPLQSIENIPCRMADAAFADMERKPSPYDRNRPHGGSIPPTVPSRRR